MNKNVKAELVLASMNASTKDIIYTFKLTYPRFILAEVNTHTIASKNTASSRAIPTKKFLSNIFKNPFLPSSIGKYQSGMQAGEEISGWRRALLEKLWSISRYAMLGTAFLAWKLGAPKQFSNRLVEPWMTIEQIWTSTDVENELLLRNHPDVEPHYHELARQKQEIVTCVKQYFNSTAFSGSLELYNKVVPKCQVLDLYEWHLPFWRGEQDYALIDVLVNNSLDETGILSKITIAMDEFSLTHKGKIYKFPYVWKSRNSIVDFANTVRKAISCARCAWVSYEMPGENSDKMNNVVSALITYHKLIISNPKHLSPTQHVATPLPTSVRVGNLCGWLQHRKEIEGEAGGDKVVVSITPDMAKDLLSHPIEPIIITINGTFHTSPATIPGWVYSDSEPNNLGHFKGKET